MVLLQNTPAEQIDEVTITRAAHESLLLVLFTRVQHIHRVVYYSYKHALMRSFQSYVDIPGDGLTFLPPVKR